MRRDPRTVYAQSSDIRSRTYLEYRRDMKRKAIAELEVIEWLQQALQQEHPNKSVRVSKSGGDSFLWFLREGGVTREPDFVAEIDGQQLQIEFQYAEAPNLPFYDFKVSKVAATGKDAHGQRTRVPRQNVLFLYIDKPTVSYALLKPEWIMENGQVGEVAAWRAQAYRVPAEIFHQKLRSDTQLTPILQTIECKNRILEFQHTLLGRVRARLARRIAEAVENRQAFTIVPSNLESFFDACFIMAALQERPKHPGNWLQQAIQFAEAARSPETAFQATYCLDFLYFHIPAGEPLPLLIRFAEVIHSLMRKLNNWYSATDGAYRFDSKIDPCTETRYALFIANSLEDLIQDMLHYCAEELKANNVSFTPIRKIYQSLNDPIKTAEFILRCDS